MRFSLVTLACAMFLVTAVPVDSRTVDDDFVVHGTIDVALGNRNGIVVLTDSILTSGTHQLSNPGEKLFKLDDHTVCAIAGFVSAPGPVPDLNASTSGILHEYIRQSAQQPTQTIAEKLKVLASLLNAHLTGIANVRQELKVPTRISNYALQLVIAGYDADGQPKIGKILLATSPMGPMLQSNLQEAEIVSVGQELVWKLGGMPDVAQRILSHPETISNDRVLSRYALSLREDRGQSLTVQEMVSVAKRLAYYTSKTHREVGGPNQVAMLKRGSPIAIEQPPLRKAPKPPIRFGLTVDVSFTNGVAILEKGSAVVFIRCSWNGTQRESLQDDASQWMKKSFGSRREVIELDGNYFFGNNFTNYVLTYDGGPVTFDGTNRVKHSMLFFGHNAKPDGENVLQLERHFQRSGLDGNPSDDGRPSQPKADRQGLLFNLGPSS